MLKKILILFLLFNLFILHAQSKTIKNFKVIGNERISDEVIKVFSKVELPSELSSNDLDRILKNLYNSNFFDDVKIHVDKDTLFITVIENPIIQTVQVDGIKNKKLKETIEENFILKNKSSYNDYLAQQDLNQLKNFLKTVGYYFSEVKVLKIKNNNNTIDLKYEINLGEKALIGSIQFLGDKKFKNRKLRNVITSETSKFWKFLSSKKYIDQERINLDTRLLKNFYLNKGYYKIKIENSFAEFLDENKFKLIFKINAGEKYYFNELKLNIPEDYDKKNFKFIVDSLSDLKGKAYSLNVIEKIIEEIDNIALTEQYEFIDADISETIVSKNKLNFEISVKETKKDYVERIDIFGNTNTYEEVIRNELLIDEGDGYNKILHNKSIANLKALGFFGKVTSEMLEGSTDNKKIIRIDVEERPTGEITAGAGVGTGGSSFGFGVKENNFLGKGIGLNTNLSVSDDSIKGLFSYTNPNFNYSDKSLVTSIGAEDKDKLDKYGYRSSLTHFNLGTRFEQYRDIYFSPNFKIQYENIETDSSASNLLKKQEGNYFDALFVYGLTLDKRNQTFQPTDGFISSFNQTFPILSDTGTFVNGYTITKYNEITDDLITSISFYIKASNSLTDDDVRISERLILPPKRLRGFQFGKIGPKDGDDYIGGNYASTLNFATTLPNIIPDIQNADVKFFFDLANVWGVDYSDTLADSNKIRSSTGVGVDWWTPLGPLTFSFAQAISKADTDKTETFRFRIGTTF